jgi:hypothetical protein
MALQVTHDLLAIYLHLAWVKLRLEQAIDKIALAHRGSGKALGGAQEHSALPCRAAKCKAGQPADRNLAGLIASFLRTDYNNPVVGAASRQGRWASSIRQA